MNTTDPAPVARWYAIKTANEMRAKTLLAPHCDEIFFPQIKSPRPGGKTASRALIPHVIFIRTTHDQALRLEHRGRMSPGEGFWIFRYPNDPEIQVIPPQSIDLLRLLTIEPSDTIRVFAAPDITVGKPVRITGGKFEGYQGIVKRIKRDRRVLVQIEGICMVMLPFIDPSLLQPL